ncbi:C40 family peptidase [Nonomuraea sp. NPDC050478]|uniref:C40 family peptidase n=1 Tax=Nonomuraea sp. NPDC050478 TaxID=3364365 RepID=UPI0037B828D0
MSGRRGVLLAMALVLLVVTASAPIKHYVLPRIVAIAYEIERHGIVYSWGGGHAERPGPSTGTCAGYTGRIKPCPATRTRGLDCSGLTRWVYALAHGADVLGPGNTDDHVRRMRQVRSPVPGDLVFFGERKKKRLRTRHVGIYLGLGRMMNAPETGAIVRVDDIAKVPGFLGFYRY